jgi:hypothetical protein
LSLTANEESFESKKISPASQMKKGLQTFLRSFNYHEKFSDTDYKLENLDRDEIIEILKESLPDSDGRILPFPTAVDLMNNFSDAPLQLTIGDSLVKDFIDRINLIDISTAFPNHEFGLRIYFGHEKPSSTGPLGKNKYQILIVPICLPQISSGIQRDHTLDKENQLFLHTGDPFALAITETKKGISIDKNEWRAITLNADELSPTELIFYSFKQFTTFRNATDNARRTELCLSFCRVSEGESLSAILTFLDSSGSPLESTVTSGGLTARGVFFDQGDLIPPPSPVPDKSF